MEIGPADASPELAEQEGTPETCPLTVRNAVAGDACAVASILAGAFPSLYRGTFGDRDMSTLVWLLQSLYEAGHLSLEDTRVCELNGEVAGLMILHTGRSIGRGRAVEFWRLVRRRFGLFSSVRIFGGGILANYMLDQRIPRAPDLVYIEALAVAEPYRGRGIGSRLLLDAEQWATARQRSRLALHVLASNAGARRLYKRTGFLPWNMGSRSSPWRSNLPTSSWAAILLARRLEEGPE